MVFLYCHCYILGSSLQEEANTIANQNPRVEPVLIDILQRPDHMKTLVEAADLVISLLPFQLHHLVAECCISAHTNMVTASYCTLDMMRLHDKYALVYSCRLSYQSKF